MDSWQDTVEAISAALGTVFVIAAAWIALRQWKESLSTRLTQGALALISQLQEGATRETRDYLTRNHEAISKILAGPHPLEGLDSYLSRHEREDAPASVRELRRSFATLEFIAILCLTNQLPRELERGYLGPTMAQHWKVAQPVVMAIRERYGNDIYLQHAEALAGMLKEGKLFGRRSALHKRKELQRIERRSRSVVPDLFLAP
jgi:hypothetical protein